ncbi:sensor histidine kinase [Lysinimonas soli]|uniref:histidine kinase n=1 Tax=Lysinimonas soli TaxID=1074233 RepID=A0ABW0NQ15_9MICO
MFRKLSQSQLAADLVVAGIWTLLTGFAGGIDAARAGVALGMGAALAFRRLSPPVALGIAWLASLVQVFALVPPQVSNLAILAMLYATAAYGSKTVRWVAFASTFLGAAVITVAEVGPQVAALLADNGLGLPGLWSTRSWLGNGIIIFVGSTAAFLLSWTGGLLVRTWRQARESRRAAVVSEQEVVAEQERTRIARDMHDVVAHSLAVVVAQADGARYLGATDPAATDAALAAIASTAREALSDVRVLLAQLRHSQGDGPQPTLVDLGRLLEQLRGSGLIVVQEVTGTPLALGTGQQLAIYRIVQESLTNALRHADPAQEVVVHFAWTMHGLDLTISSALVAQQRASRATRPIRTIGASDAPAMPGHGIAGMTERAALVGGHLTAGVDGDRFLVHAWLPEQPALDRTGVRA